METFPVTYDVKGRAVSSGWLTPGLNCPFQAKHNSLQVLNIMQCKENQSQLKPHPPSLCLSSKMTSATPLAAPGALHSPLSLSLCILAQYSHVRPMNLRFCLDSECMRTCTGNKRQWLNGAVYVLGVVVVVVVEDGRGQQELGRKKAMAKPVCPPGGASHRVRGGSYHIQSPVGS